MRAGPVALAVVALSAGVVFGPQIKRALPSFLVDIFDNQEQRAIAASLLMVQQQNALTVLSARLSAVVTTKTVQTIAGIEIPGTLKITTMVAPGNVNYNIIFTNLTRKDLVWDGQNNTLVITVPEPAPVDVRIDDRETETFVNGVTLPWTDEVSKLARKANYDKAFRELQLQAKSPVMLKLAREAGRAAVVNNMGLPLKAAGVNAQVLVRFQSEAALPALTKG